MAVELITFSGKTVTAMNDAIVHDAEMGASGILYGCEITASGSTITVGGGYGLVKGRLFQITTTALNANISGSSGVGQVFIKLDVTNSSLPISLLVRTGSDYATMESDDTANYTGGVYWMELARFEYNSGEGITIIWSTYTMLPTKGVVVYTDPSELGLENPPVAEMWNTMPDNSVAIVPTDKFASASVPQNGLIKIVKLADDCGYAVCEPNATDGVVYKVPLGNAGSVWEEQPRMSDIFYMPGDRVHLSLATVGYLTSGTSALRLLTPWSKLVGKVNGIRLISGHVTLRQNNKYLADDVSFTQQTSANIYGEPVINPNGLWLTVTKKNGWGGVNNDAVGITGAVDVEFT